MNSTPMQTNLLSVEHKEQEHPTGCLAACIQMALAHIGIRQTQRQLNRLLGLTSMGVPMSRVRDLHKYKFRGGLWSGFRSQTVNVVYKSGDEHYIHTQIDQSWPIILFVQTGQLQSYWPRATQHALLCIGYDDEYVYFNDPAFADGPKHVVWDELMLAWLEFDYMCAVLSSW